MVTEKVTTEQDLRTGGTSRRSACWVKGRASAKALKQDCAQHATRRPEWEVLLEQSEPGLEIDEGWAGSREHLKKGGIEAC